MLIHNANQIEPRFGLGFIGLDYKNLAVTGAERVYLTRRFSLDPEILYVTGNNDRGTQTQVLQFGPAAAYTLIQSRFAPYVIGGPGFGRIRRTFNCQIRCVVPPSTSFSWTNGSAGGGVRIRTGNSFFISPEFRVIGDKEGLYYRFTVGMGLGFGAVIQ
jgi:hypothetical protein